MKPEEVRVIGLALGTIAAWGQAAEVAADEDVLAPPGSPDQPAPVVGGEPAPAGAWDDAVALYTPADQFACSGVLVAPDLVLTAGHCGAGLGGVVVGTTDHRRGGEKIQIAEILVHDDYYTTFDAAILVLEHPAAVIAPRVLALDCIAEDYVETGAEVVIVGFGATDEWANEWTTELQQGFTTISDPVCADLSAGCYEAVSPGGELIAGGAGIDSCSGDSGGPLYLRTPEGDFLVGITSRARVPAETPCGGGGIYVRADALAAWIEAETGQILPRPECDGRNRPPAPVASPIDVVVGESGVSIVEPHDPDDGQHHTTILVRPPAHGIALVDQGAVLYLAPDVFVGDDLAVVEVTDDGDPPISVEVEVAIHVTAGGPVETRGCSTSPAVGGGWLVVLGWIGRRRRCSR